MPVAAPLAAAASFVGAHAVPLAIAGSSIASSVIGANAANKAAKTQANAANAAAQQQMDMFNTIRGDLSPYRDFGGTALPGLSRLLGIDTGGSFTGAGLSGTGGFTGAAGSPDWNDYLNRYTDVQSNYTQRMSTPEGRAELQALGISSPQQFAQWFQNVAVPAAGDRRTVNTISEQGTPDWADYLKRYPDVQAFWENMSPEDKAHYPTVESFAQYFQNGPSKAAGENRTLNYVAPGTGVNTNPMQASLEAIPGYQFARDQGIQSVNRQLGSKGLTGAQAKGIARFVTGLADQTYGEQVQRLMNVASMGQNAANQTGAFGQTAATNAGNAMIGGANAQAAGQVGSANAIGSALSSIPNAFLANKILGSGLYSGGADATGGATAGGWGSGYTTPTAGTFNFTG